MTEDVSENVKLGVEVALCSYIIASMVSLLAVAQTLTFKISEQDAANIALQEYREFNQYDHTQVYPQDIVAVIYKYRGSPAVSVSSTLGNYSWTLSSSPCDYNTVSITALINQDVVYDSELEYGVNGGVVSIKFVAHTT